MVLKTKTDLKDRHDDILRLCFLLIDWSSFGEGERDSLEIGHSRSIGWMNFGRKWTRGMGGCLKIGQFSWTLYVYYPLKLVTIPHISKKSCHCYYCCCTWNTATGMKCCLFSFISNLPSKKCENMNSLGWGFSIQENRMIHHDRTEQLCSVTMTEQSAPPNLIIVSYTRFLLLIAKGLI